MEIVEFKDEKVLQKSAQKSRIFLNIMFNLVENIVFLISSINFINIIIVMIRVNYSTEESFSKAIQTIKGIK